MQLKNEVKRGLSDVSIASLHYRTVNAVQIRRRTITSLARNDQSSEVSSDDETSDEKDALNDLPPATDKDIVTFLDKLRHSWIRFRKKLLSTISSKVIYGYCSCHVKVDLYTS